MIVILLTIMTIAGCSHLKSPPEPKPKPEPEPISHEAYNQLQHEIKQLKNVIQEKDKIILKQRKQQQHQVKAQQDTSQEATRTQLKLHRLATKPSAASTIAEVKVAMEKLTKNPISTANQHLQIQAQYLFDTATRLYALDEYASSMHYAAQAYEIINMATDKNRSASTSKRLIVTFQVPVMLYTKTRVNLRKGSNINTTILATLDMSAVLIANAYQGNWLRVQTEDNDQGWVLSTLVETQISNVH